jgi:dihydrofolate reductase
LRDVILYIAVSIDGYIARVDGSVDWLDRFANDSGPDYGYTEFYDSIDTTLTGRKTHEQILGFDVPYPYQDKTNYVFSSTPIADTPHVKWGGPDAVSFVRDLKNRGREGIWLVGGAGLNSQLNDAGLIDRMIVSVMPIVLGAGIPLFRGASGPRVWQFDGSVVFETGVVQLTYERRDDHMRS